MRRLGSERVVVAGLVFLTLGNWWTGFDQRRTQVHDVRSGCMRSTLERVLTARKDAADSLREAELTHAPGQAARPGHALSAVNAEQAARGLLRLAGIPSGWPLENIARLDPESAEVTAERRAFCQRVFPDASLL